MNIRAQKAFEYLYDEGDIDIILLGYILGLVSSDESDVSYEKSDDRRLEDAIKVIKYLVSTNDFEVGRTVVDGRGNFQYEAFNDIEEFVEIAQKNFEKGGIDDIELITETWLRKSCKGSRPKNIPKYIQSIFE
ncbi:hypothetical protein IB270_33740 [Ensifer sp. ENS05]|uniref:hypothetical protein n=1 Tax=Ensifer sp. ENS05 TaxID=2769277 RepID=UPI00177EF740|nr:hypothetical protein [Ensifer sp. ENS05]MBD9597789.1 hypothetical protein [Ensifer sp. ENS05]